MFYFLKTVVIVSQLFNWFQRQKRGLLVAMLISITPTARKTQFGTRISVLSLLPFVSLSVELRSKLDELLECNCSTGEGGGELAMTDSDELSASSLLNSTPKLSAKATYY